MIIAAPSLIYVLWSMQRFNTKFNWEKLPYEEMMVGHANSKTPRDAVGSYVQPELVD